MLSLWRGADAQLLLINVCERSFLAVYSSGFVLSRGRWGLLRGDVVAANSFLDPLLEQLLCLKRSRLLRGCCQRLSDRVDLAEFGGRRNVGGQRSFAAIVVILLSERGRCSYRTARTDYCFRAHSNLWWARHGWPRLHLVARRDSLFSRPPYFTAGVNLTAEFPSEPPRGGEHGAGENCLNQKKIIRGIPKLSKIIECVSRRHGQQQTPLALGETSNARMRGSFPYIAP